MTLGVSAPISCGRLSGKWIDGKEKPLRRRSEGKGALAHDHFEILRKSGSEASDSKVLAV